ncbi:unnamed protein product [Ceratitis capitata]|uniref:(Mediterranean fruit fly) hypothetical protein n=1 Tax=Ceratitis capitata TaxID=7213 RepID=A0A811U3B9_CERCA|nr:unnamed protein product [Ceratitis capitata]
MVYRQITPVNDFKRLFDTETNGSQLAQSPIYGVGVAKFHQPSSVNFCLVNKDVYSMALSFSNATSFLSVNYGRIILELVVSKSIVENNAEYAQHLLIYYEFSA